MNPVSLLRSCTGVTQSALAAGAGTSQPTIAMYESGAKSPTLETLERLASSQGLELVIHYVPELTREDRRSLRYHEAVSKILRQRPVDAKAKARRLLAKMSALHPEAGTLFRRWREWLKLPTEDLISRLLDPGLLARDMRQVSPFAGLLGPKERLQILKEFREETSS